MVLRKILDQYVSSYQRWSKLVVRLGNNEVLKSLTKTLTFVNADANARGSTIALRERCSGELEKIHRWQKSMQNYPACKELKRWKIYKVCPPFLTREIILVTSVPLFEKGSTLRGKKLLPEQLLWSSLYTYKIIVVLVYDTLILLVDSKGLDQTVQMCRADLGLHCLHMSEDMFSHCVTIVFIIQCCLYF